MIFLSKPSIIQHRIFTRTSVSLSKKYNWTALGVLDSTGSNVPHYDFFPLEHGMRKRLLERLPVARQSGHFP